MHIGSSGSPEINSGASPKPKETSPDFGRRPARVVLCIANPELQDQIEEAVEREDDQVIARVEQLEEVARVAVANQADAVIVDAEADEEELQQVISNTHSSVPYVIVQGAEDAHAVVDVEAIRDVLSDDPWYQHPVVETSVHALSSEVPEPDPAQRAHAAAANFRLWPELMVS